MKIALHVLRLFWSGVLFNLNFVTHVLAGVIGAAGIVFGVVAAVFKEGAEVGDRLVDRYAEWMKERGGL